VTDSHSEKRPWALESTAATIAYWATIAAFVAGLSLTRALPLVDYPQHLAVAATLRRLWLGQIPAGLYETNLAGYNSLFHVATAALPLPVELAGKLVLAAYFALFGLAAIALADAVSVPRWRALLLLPLAVGYTFAYGFANYGLALSLQLLVFARVTREQRTWPTAVLALLGMYAHVLASAFVFAPLALIALARRRARSLLPLLPAVLYCAFVALVSHGTARQNTEFVPLEGQTMAVTTKLARFFHFASGLRADGVDALVVMAVVAFAVLGALASTERAAPLRLAVVAATFIAYLALPHVLSATPFIFERVAALVVVALVLAVPTPRASLEGVFRAAACVLAAVSAALFLESMNSARRELADVERVLDAAPPNRRLVGLMFHPYLPSFRLRALLHAPAYYVARKPGELAWMFETVSLPVRPIRAPEQRLPVLFELNPSMYEPAAPYARHFDLVFVKASQDPQQLVFHGPRRVVAQSGELWLFENR